MKHRRKVKQINNIIIYHVPIYGSYVCVSPDGKYLREFAEQLHAENWCRETTEFSAKGRKQEGCNLCCC